MFNNFELFLEFVNVGCTDNVKKALDDYIQTSEKILQANFENSPLEALEKIILDPKGNIKLCAGVPNIDPLNLDEAFIALIAPSFAGKTQSAFVMRTVRPLYFSFEIDDDSQLVYKNFKSLSSHLLEDVVELDFDMIQNSSTYKKLYSDIKATFSKRKRTQQSKKALNPIKEKIILRILSSESLLRYFGSFQFRSLGFLMALIKKAESEYNPAENNWIRYFSNISSFYYTAANPTDFIQFLSGIRNKYCWFLDEFNVKEKNVLLRNLACAVKGIAQAKLRNKTFMHRF